VQEAAEVLGSSVDAVRSRIRRGSVESEKEPDGRVFVWLDPDESGAQSQVQNEGSRALVEEMRGRIEDLREQLAAERRANEENRRIIAALTQRIPEIEPPAQGVPSEPPGSPESATEQPGRVGPQPSVEGAQTDAQPRRAPWWRRVFGG